MYIRVVLREVGVYIVERPGEVQALKDVADEVDDQREGVGNEDWRTSLIGLRKEE